MQSYGASTLPQRSGGSIVPEEHYRLAVHAVASLLHQDHRDHTTVPHILLTGNTEEAVLLLPIIENYLTHYLHLVRSAGDAGSPSQVSTIPSCGSSGESSPDSVTSHLRALMYDGATYANHMEKCTLNALWMLKVLVDYSGHVRNSLCDNASMECATSNDLMQRTSGTSSTLTAQTSGTAGSTPTVNKVCIVFLQIRMRLRLDKTSRATVRLSLLGLHASQYFSFLISEHTWCGMPFFFTMFVIVFVL